MLTMILYMLLQTAMLVFGQVALKLGMRDMPAWEWSWPYIWHEVILNLWFLISGFGCWISFLSRRYTL